LNLIINHVTAVGKREAQFLIKLSPDSHFTTNLFNHAIKSIWMSIYL